MSCSIVACAVERDATRIATEHPALWREVRRFNLPVKLALAAAQRTVTALEAASQARLLALAPCRLGSPELRQISRELDAGFARGSCDKLRVNPIYTLHAIDNLALSALAIRIENRERAICLGGAAGQAWDALEQALDELVRGTAREVLLFGGDQGDAAWRGDGGDDEGCGVALVLAARPGGVRLLAVEREAMQGATAMAHAVASTPHASASGSSSAMPHAAEASSMRPHAARGLAAWLDALAAAPPGRFAYRVPAVDGDGIDAITIVAEVGA